MRDDTSARIEYSREVVNRSRALLAAERPKVSSRLRTLPEWRAFS
jgi:hypothetical protein